MTLPAVRGPVDATQIPRYAGPSTFARLPRARRGRPGGRRRRGRAVRLRGVLPARRPFRPRPRPRRPRNCSGPTTRRWMSRRSVASRSPTPATSRSTRSTSARPSRQIEAAAATCCGRRRQAADHRRRPHHRAAPAAVARARTHGPVAVLHFDAHLDTWDTYFGAPYTHGTPFRRASRGRPARPRALPAHGHAGAAVRQPGPRGRPRLGFQIVRSDDYETDGVTRDRRADARPGWATRPVYVSIDIDVLDPAHAPGTGTPEAGGLTSRELLNILRGLVGLNIIGADIVEVSPAVRPRRDHRHRGRPRRLRTALGPGPQPARTPTPRPRRPGSTPPTSLPTHPHRRPDMTSNPRNRPPPRRPDGSSSSPARSTTSRRRNDTATSGTRARSGSPATSC